MDDPVTEIPAIITTLCTAPYATQQAAIEQYFTNDAAFVHPFCRTISIPHSRTLPAANSRWLIKQIYTWYKILSPRIEVHVESVAFDRENLLLYAGIRQVFGVWFVPGYKARPKLVTVLRLVRTWRHGTDTHLLDDDSLDADGDKQATETEVVEALKGRKYYIASQEDLYQTSEFVKFVLPFGGLGEALVVVWQVLATLLCVLGAWVFWPLTLVRERLVSEREKLG